MDCINKIPSGEAPGFNGLSPFVIKQARYALAKPLAEIFNKCLTAGIFPDSLKIAQVRMNLLIKDLSQPCPPFKHYLKSLFIRD